MKKPAFLIICSFLFSAIPAQNNSTENEVDPKYREFDFWIGEWDVYLTGTKDVIGYSKVESIVDGFAVRESYQSSKSKYSGTSLNKYNPVTGQWEQYWVDSSGLTLLLKGRKSGNVMILENEIETSEGMQANRISWIQKGDGTVQQTWEQSFDGGESWNKIFDGHYKKQKAGKNKK